MGNLAVPTSPGLEKESQNSGLEVLETWPPLKVTAAKLFAAGSTPNDVYTAFTRLKRFQGDRGKVRRIVQKWMREEQFLQVVWELGVGRYAVQSPQVVGGLFRKARRGRVDAAKFFLELAGFYDPKPDAQAEANVTVVMGDIPRPARDDSDTATAIRGEILEAEPVEDGNWEDVD